MLNYNYDITSLKGKWTETVKFVDEKPLVMNHSISELAIITIQKHVRGYLARKPFLSSKLYSKVRIECEKTKLPQARFMLRAEGGKTTVFLPQEIPEIILKRSGRKFAIQRFHQMQEVRAVLNSQNSSHLIIPKALLCQDFLIEERLPINIDSYYNMGLYLSYSKLFDQAIRELTRLFSKRHIDDLVSYQRHIPLSNIGGIDDCVRYDNLPLYIVDKNGKKEGRIGLIDLERIKNPSSEGLATLARIFPFHLNIIQEEAIKLKMEMDYEQLTASAEKGKKYIQVGFSDHLIWLKQKGINTKNTLQSFEVSLKRVNEITNVVEKELFMLNQGIGNLERRKYENKDKRHFIAQNSDEVIKEFAVFITPLIVEKIKSQLEKVQRKQLRKLSGQCITESELISLRSPIMQWHKMNCKDKFTNIKFQKNCWFDKRDVAEQLTYVVIQELVKGGQIFFFDPAYYSSNYLCWIRY